MRTHALTQPGLMVVAIAAVWWITGCGRDSSTMPAELPRDDLIGVWHVEQLDGKPVLEGREVSIRFYDDGHWVGKATINQVGGSWSLEAGKLAIEHGGSTLMSGSKQGLQQEGQYLFALRRTEREELDPSGRLVLRAGDGAAVMVAARP